MKKIIPFLILLGLLLSISQITFAQKRHKSIVQLSGLVMTADSGFTVPGVTVLVRHSSRGTFTNQYGFFSIPVTVGDSIIFRAISFKPVLFVVPDTMKKDFSIIIKLQIDTTILQTVEIFPLPTERVFKEMFLALKLEEDMLKSNMKKNLDQDLMTRLLYEYAMDGQMNYKANMQQHIIQAERRYMVPTIPFLNPFAWSELIKSIKRGDYKKKKWQED
jgi:hypothetical protein